MLLTIHDANLQKVAFIDNDKQGTLNYYDDTWHRSLETGSSTFEFTVFKKAIQSDIPSQKTYNYLNERAFISFRYKGRSYVFSVMTVEEDEQTIKCYCENLNLELINEYTNPYKAEKAMSFVEYCNAMDLLNLTHLSVGINEISDQKRTLEWEGQDTKLARLLSLAKKFDAEVDFETHLNDDSSIKAFKVNVYHENDATHQGVGRVRNDIQLTYGKNLKSIKRKIDKTGIYTMIRPTGKRTVKNGAGEEVEEVVTIGSLGAWSENNADGVREFFQGGDALYAPLAAQMYPSTFSSKTQGDQWIRKDMEVESDNPSVIRAAAIANLRKNAYPAISYEVDGFVDVEIGDTIKIYDNGFSPLLLVRARVSEQKVSFTNPASNKTTFANFKALENNLSSGIQAAFDRLFEASKPYIIKLSTDNGVIFKNQIGQSLVTPTLYKGGKPVVAGVTWRWSLDGDVTTSMTYLVRGSSVTDTATLTVAAYVGDDEVAVDEISFVNVVDGKLGTPGKPGADGRTPYVHTAWANNETGTIGFSLDSSINKLYIGIYTDYEIHDSTDPKKYKWTKIKGDKGDKGDPGQRGVAGLQGEKGEQGIPGEKGADGRTQYTHVAYANSADGRKDFSVSASDRDYIGMYVDFNSQDSTNPADYAWTLVKGSNGNDGIPGKAGADGKTPYLHVAYATSNNGLQGFSISDSTNKMYIGTYTDYTQADSTDPRRYKWTLIKGSDGNGIANVTNYYLATASSTGVTRNTAGWTTTPQAITSSKRYHWSYRVELYTNGTNKTTEPAIIGVYGDTGVQGIQGLQGPKGDQGIPGAKGADGRTQYTHIAYADNATGGGFSQLPHNKAFVGVYVDFNQTDSTNPTAYKWTKWRGDDGAQGIPGKAGADGKTPYVHFAYAESADGRTGFSTTQTGNKRYIGTYTDHTQDDSQDYTKYNWTALFGNSTNGSYNLIKNGAFPTEVPPWTAAKISTHDFYYKGQKRLFLLETAGTNEVVSSSNRFELKRNTEYSLSFYAFSSSNVRSSDVFILGRKTGESADFTIVNKIISDRRFSSGAAEYITITFNSGQADNAYLRFDNNGSTNGQKAIMFFGEVMLIEGNAAQKWSASYDDIKEDINSKADNVLTQAQLNALSERSQIQEAELKAKASMSALSELEKAYQSFVKANNAAIKKSEADLVEAGRRLDLLTTQFGGLRELKTFIDTYMTSSNEGLIIGKNDASSTIKVSHDRISMFSAGKEVMYISQGVINIDNGIFTASVQIGRFRTEQYHANADMNVIRYVG